MSLLVDMADKQFDNLRTVLDKHIPLALQQTRNINYFCLVRDKSCGLFMQREKTWRNNRLVIFNELYSLASHNVSV